MYKASAAATRSPRAHLTAFASVLPAETQQGAQQHMHRQHIVARTSPSSRAPATSAKRPRASMAAPPGREEDAARIVVAPASANRSAPPLAASQSHATAPVTTYSSLAAKRPRAAVSLSVPPSKRFTPGTVSAPGPHVHTLRAAFFSALPPAKRRRRAPTPPPPTHAPTRLPQLPADVWHHVAALLPACSLAALAETSTLHRAYAQRARDRLLWTALYGASPTVAQAAEVPALLAMVTLLDGTPSLRHKRVCAQLAGLAAGRSPAGDASVHFTEAQAVAFLGVEPYILGRYAPARVRAGAPRARRKAGGGLALALFPPDGGRRAERVFGLGAVLRAARASAGGGFGGVREKVERAVREDCARFKRAERAEGEVRRLVRECGAEVREVEYLLGASGRVMEFRQGRWRGGVEGYVREVRELLRVHEGLGGCYRCLLICDGNARLKAKRIVGKILKGCGGFRTREVVRALEGNLWWARSKSNVQKMEEMSRSMPHIRV